MSAYFADHDVELHQGDASTVLGTLPEASVNCIVTSPPYFGLRDYGCDGQLGLEPSPSGYVAALCDVFAQAWRVLRDDGVLWLNLGDSYVTHDPGGWRQGEHLNPGGRQAVKGSGRNRAGTQAPGMAPKNLMGMPWRVAFALQEDGWTLRNDIIWHKPNAMPESVTDRLWTRYEHVFLFSKSRHYWFDLDPIRVDRSAATMDRYQYAFKPNTNPASATAHLKDGGMMTGANEAGKNPGDVWDIPTNPFPGAHFATMPPALVRRCILAGCPQDGTVLDPFAGAGTTLMVARSLGRKSIGIELNPDYCAIAVGRVGPSVLDFAGGA